MHDMGRSGSHRAGERCHEPPVAGADLPASRL